MNEYLYTKKTYRKREGERRERGKGGKADGSGRKITCEQKERREKESKRRKNTQKKERKMP